MQVKIGKFTVTSIVDAIDIDGAPLVSYEAQAAAAIYAAAGIDFVEDKITMSIHAFVIEGPGICIAVDTGSPLSFANGMASKYGENFRAAGFTPEQITHVVLTHLHIDHVGFMRDASGAAFFPNAELLLSKAELDFVMDQEIYDAGPPARQSSMDLGRASIAPYKARTRAIDAPGEIVPGLTLVPLYGHTAGHSGVLIEDGEARLLIFGDVVHHPVLQSARPDWACIFDASKPLGEATRRGVFAQAADEGLLVAGMHLSPPGFAHVRRAGDAFAIDPIS
ncbi:MAG: glyoxylase-like metal-dependent hydrolase (beta-lactamase superfamily II) [Halocynthiibacter sp.]|jgi:glyoxylase-like metal-dependent hydrolase (beta-lactamase superfamily II)